MEESRRNISALGNIPTVLFVNASVLSLYSGMSSRIETNIADLNNNQCSSLRFDTCVKHAGYNDKESQKMKEFSHFSFTYLLLMLL